MSDGKNDFVLIIGDSYIPQRCSDLPASFKELLQTDKIKTVLCTGNIPVLLADQFKKMGDNYHTVRGDIDDKTNDAPDELTVEIANFKIGVVGGTNIIPYDQLTLNSLQRRMGVDILVTGGHPSAQFMEFNRTVILMPGSCTGNPTSTATTPVKSTPSFMLMTVQEGHIIVYIYEEVNGETKVQMHEHRKRVVV